MTGAAIWAFVRGIPLLAYPLALAVGLWLYERGEHADAVEETAKLQAKFDAHLVDDEKATLDANLLANRAALRYEDQRIAAAAEAATVTKEIRDALDANPDWSRTRLPDGLRDAISKAASIADPAGSAGRVPAASQPAPRNERGFARGVGRSSRSVAGVPRSASGSR